MNRKCDYFRDLIMEDLAGELQQDKRCELNEHLEKCRACAQEQEELTRVAGLLGDFEDLPVPRHFFVNEPPRITLVQLVRNLSPGARWGAAAAAAVLVFLFGMVLLNTQVQFRNNAVMVSFGPAENLNSEQEISDQIVSAVKEAREEDRLVLDRVLERQNQLVGASLQQLDQKVETRFNEMEGSFFATMEVNNRNLKNQIEVNLLKYGEMLRTQHQGDFKRMNNRLDQIALEGRRRETQNGAIMATLAQYGLPGNRPKGAIYD